MSDEHQATALSCADHCVAQTPNLDALCARGVRFTNAYTPSPICVPARAAFASGQYVHRNRLWDNAMPYTGSPKGWGHALQAEAIRVESIGKLHYRSEEDPAGFDVEHIPMQVVDGVGMVWASIRGEHERVVTEKRMLGDYIGPGNSKYTDYDAAVVERSSEWFESAATDEGDSPWCLYIGLVAPHFPLVVPQEFFDLYPHAQLPPDKLIPGDGYEQHPWIVKAQGIFANNDQPFRDEKERLDAIASYFGLCSWLDFNIGKILESLKANGFADNTTVVYTSDHGDNVGARGLWGKSNMYEESVAIPMIVVPPEAKVDSQPEPQECASKDLKPGSLCETPVSLLDLSATIVDHFDVEPLKPDAGGYELDAPGESLYKIAAADDQSERTVFSEYHAVGAVSAAYMIRKGDWKYIHYHGFEPELFNLTKDPEEFQDLASDPACRKVRDALFEELCTICDPKLTNDLAFADQADLVERHGGRERALTLGAPAATPPPEV